MQGGQAHFASATKLAFARDASARGNAALRVSLREKRLVWVSCFSSLRQRVAPGKCPRENAATQRTRRLLTMIFVIVKVIAAVVLLFVILALEVVVAIGLDLALRRLQDHKRAGAAKASTA